MDSVAQKDKPSYGESATIALRGTGEAEQKTCSACWFKHQGRCINPHNPIGDGYLVGDIPECSLMRPRYFVPEVSAPCDREFHDKTCGECAQYRPRRELCIRFREQDEHDEPACILFEPRKIELKRPSPKLAELLAARRFKTLQAFAEKILERMWVDWESGEDWIVLQRGMRAPMTSDQLLEKIIQRFKLENIGPKVGKEILDAIKYVLLTTMREYVCPVNIEITEVDYIPPYDKRVKAVHQCGECAFWLNGLCLSAKVRDQLGERPKVGPLAPACEFRRSVLDERQ